MSDEENKEIETVNVSSTRFGELSVAKDSVIHFPAGVIGFPTHQNYILVEHKPPFSWLQSVEEPALAFVVIDGFEFALQYDLSLPFSDKECDFRPDDEYAILVIVTVRPDPRQTTANIKAPLFINIRNKRAVQVIYDDPQYTTRFPLWSEDANLEGEKEPEGK